jgi:ElaB/YqjD/DUF883 family membrane-anchored ribosome-binding protein
MATAAPAEGREAFGAASLGDRFKWGLKGLKSSIAATTVAAAEGGSQAEASSSSRKDGEQQVPSLFSWAEKARKAVAENVKVAYEAVPQLEPAQEGESAEEGVDIEKGEATGAGMWGAWAKKANAMKKQVETAAKEAAEEAHKGLKQGVQRAKTLDLGDPAAMVTAQVTKGMTQVSKSASTVGAAVQEKGKVASAKANELKEKSAQKMNDAKAKASDKAREAKEKANAVAGAAKNKLSEAGSSVTGAVGGLAALTMSPMKLAQFIAIFFVGIMLITLSFTFLPVLVISPQKFALLFAFGSIVVMGSLAFLKGPKALMSQLIQREKLPFSGTYVVGLVGTLVATIVLRSFVLTAIFGIMQAVALMYFLASYVPGGKAVLNFCGKCTSRCAQKLVGCRRK